MFFPRSTPHQLFYPGIFKALAKLGFEKVLFLHPNQRVYPYEVLRKEYAKSKMAHKCINTLTLQRKLQTRIHKNKPYPLAANEIDFPTILLM